MITRFLSAVFVAAYLLLLSLTVGNANANADMQTDQCHGKTCRCLSSDSQFHRAY